MGSRMLEKKKETPTVVAIGYGLLPGNTGASKENPMLTLAAEVDRYTGRILDAEMNVGSRITREWVRHLMIGNDLTSLDDTEYFVTQVENGYNGASRRAITHAYRDLSQRYAEYLVPTPREGHECEHPQQR
jgi:hypothetical protein